MTVLVGRLSRRVADRKLLFALFCIALFGLAIFVDLTDLNFGGSGHNWLTADIYRILHPGQFRFIGGYLIVFASLQASESVIMSSLTKTVSAKLAAGTFNSGLLATEFGTAGRVTANGFLTLAGLMTKTRPELLMDVLFIPATVIALLSIVGMARNFELLK